MVWKPLSVFLLSLPLLFTSCTQTPEYKGISKQEAVKFGGQIEEAISNGKWKTLEGTTSKEAFVEQIAYYAHEDVPDSDMQELAAAFSMTNIAHDIVEQMENGGHYKFLNSYEKDGKRHIRFRLYTAQGLNYHDFLLCKKGDKVMAADCFVFITGEQLSETIWQERKFLRGDKNKINEHKIYYQALKTSMQKDISKGDFANALDAFKKMPASVQNSKVNLHMAIDAARNMNDTALAYKLYDTYLSQHHTKTDIHFLTLDHAYSKGDFTQVQQSIDRIDSLVGGDGWLSFMRGIVYLKNDDIKNAEKHFMRTLQYDVHFGDTYYWLALLHAQNGQYDVALNHLQHYRRSNEFNGVNEQELIDAFPELDTH